VTNSESPPVPPSPAGFRPAPLPALVVAGIVAAYGLLGTGLDLVPFGVPQDPLYLPAMLMTIVPRALGVFLLLWLFPVRHEDRLPFVVVKGLLAACAGVVLSTAVGIVAGMGQAGLGSLADLRFLPLPTLTSLLVAILQSAPLVMLAVLIQWIVTRPARP